MPDVNVIVESKISESIRVKQLEGMFDCPVEEKQRLSWHGSIPFEERDWNVGLIVGPSGSGKSLIGNQLFRDALNECFDWKADAVIDDFSKSASIEDIVKICQAVGFNTIPAWMRPYRVLSNGEQFRVGIARRLLESDDPIVVDEFTSVVDRQVAKIACHAIQKYVRRNKRHFVGISCHYDIIDWLQPDWIFEPATMTFTWRSLRQRPELDIEICRVKYEAWEIFAPFHYMSKALNKSAVCYGLFANGQLASFKGILHLPHPKAKNIKVISRGVTLPDYQGLGLSFALGDNIGAAYKALNYRLITHPAHPVFIRGFDKSLNWALTKKPGAYGGPQSNRRHCNSTMNMKPTRPCATFEYIGEAMGRATAEKLIGRTAIH